MKSSLPRKQLWGFFVLSYFITWILLFEFILPVNKIFPKPSVVLEAFIDLTKNFDLITHYLSSLGVIYLSMMAGYFIVFLLRSTLLTKENFSFNIIKSIEWYTNYIPAIVFGIFLIYWFPTSEIIEFVFSTILTVFTLTFAVKTAKKNVKSEFLDSASSLGISNKIIKCEIIWKSILPELKKEIFRLHIFLWSVLISFEFIKGGYGLGVLFKSALSYNDISGLVAVTLLTGISIFIFDGALKKILNRVVFWE